MRRGTADIADSDLAQALIEPAKGEIGEILRHFGGGRGQACARRRSTRAQMQRQELEAPLETVGDAISVKKARSRASAAIESWRRSIGRETIASHKWPHSGYKPHRQDRPYPLRPLRMEPCVRMKGELPQPSRNGPRGRWEMLR